eukprot:356240_1
MIQKANFFFKDLEETETVKTWRIGSQIVYSLLVEAHYPGHTDGVPMFLELIKNLNSESIEDITPKDTIKMFDIVVAEDRPNLLSHIINNPYIPDSHCSHNTVKGALKKAIRVGAVNVLNYMINQKVPILSSNKQ